MATLEDKIRVWLKVDGDGGLVDFTDVAPIKVQGCLMTMIAARNKYFQTPKYQSLSVSLFVNVTECGYFLFRPHQLK